MSSYKYANGVLESIETPELIPEIRWGPVGHPCPHDGEDYAWYCGLPSEGLSAGLAEGFTISLYRAATGRPPYPYMALVDLGGDDPDEIHFPELRDVIAYAREHAQLLQLTVLAGITDRIDGTMKWLFDSESGLFRDHVHEVYARQRRAAEARRRARNAAPAVTAGKTPAA
ncbi:MAG: hypothetical protein LC126_04280 [Bryobacterales bacterium]|nr:hypothetical protein [Bryobacterales bacterium]